VLLTTPAIRALKKDCSDRQVIVYCSNESHRSIYLHNPNIDKIQIAKFFSNPIDWLLFFLKPGRFLTTNYGNFGTSLYYRKKSAVEFIGEMLAVKIDDKKLEVYLTLEEEEWGRLFLAKYVNPIILHVSSIASKNQEWPIENWEKLVMDMPNYTFVQLGNLNEHKVKGVVDMRGKTSFRQALSIMKNSLSFAGVVSSFSHATSALNVRGVVLFGASTPEVWGHSNNINLYKNLPCAPCIDLLLSSRCPYNKPCMRTITVEEVKSALLRQLSLGKANDNAKTLSSQSATLRSVKPRTL